MTTSSPLDTLADLARDARDQAGQSLASERNNERHVAEQLESLRRYRLEYAQRLQQAMHGGVDPATMRNYQQFLASLDDALARARQALAAQQQRVSQTQQQWHSEQRKVSSYDTLVSRRAMQDRLMASRQEQRSTDEIVNGQVFRRQHLPEES